MKIKKLSTIVLFLSITLLAAVIACVSRLVAPHLSPLAEWLVVFLVVLGLVTLLHAWMWAARMRWARRVVDALANIVRGGEWESDPFSEFGEDLRRAIDDLNESVATLHQDKARGETILSNMGDGIIAVGHHGRITIFNRAAGTILGEKESAVLGARPEDVDLHPEIARLAHESVHQGNELQSEITLPGRPQRVIGIRATPYREAGAQVENAMIILHDLTEVRRHEKSQKEFVSNVSHELRTPITAVRTTAEVLLNGAKNDVEFVDRFLNTIISESDRLSALIGDLMEIAKRDSGITVTRKSRVGMLDVVTRAVSMVLPQARAGNIAVEIRVPDDLTAYCDDTQALHLVRNLVDNAVKYTPEGGSVDVVARGTEDGVEISVADTGIGIPHGEVERIFERFYRVDKARSRRLGGTGLGLAIVKGIVDAHDGKIDVETEIGKGSTFTVTLPEPSNHQTQYPKARAQ